MARPQMQTVRKNRQSLATTQTKFLSQQTAELPLPTATERTKFLAQRIAELPLLTATAT